MKNVLIIDTKLGFVTIIKIIEGRIDFYWPIECQKLSLVPLWPFYE